MNMIDDRVRAALLPLLFGMFACEPALETPVADESLIQLDADAVLYDMVDYLTTNGIRSGLIRADSAYVYNDSSVVRMWGVDMTLFHTDGQERANVTSLRGTLYQRTEVMIARGDVLLLLEGGLRQVQSPELHYDPQADRVRSDSNSVYTANGRVTRGTCFESDLTFENLTVCNIRGNAEMGGRGRGGGG